MSACQTGTLHAGHAGWGSDFRGIRLNEIRGLSTLFSSMPLDARARAFSLALSGWSWRRKSRIKAGSSFAAFDATR